MGLFDKLFGNNTRVSEKFQNVADSDIVAMADGKLIDVATVPDKVFASQMMGASIAFQYDQDYVTLCAPANGKLNVLFPTGHAFGIQMNNGTELLVHIGIDTVSANGNGFKVLNKKQGDSVKAGEEIIKVDLKTLREQYDMSTMLIITDPKDNKYQFIDPQMVEAGQKVIN